ncbi:acyl-CoA dehydrogenase family protein [Mesorhizobium sp. CAU 1741]|uniref:acyl-CoA dehydrogenase family protein n=1 Tax=Mesorhizobium sp. CAU 1741 TaxID=3140366 RepID=UPI00325B72F1
MTVEFNGMVPSDLAGTAEKAIAACADKSLAEQAGLMAADGLLGICASESVGGLGLPLAFALPLAVESSRAMQRFPLAEVLTLTAALEPGTSDIAEKIAAGEDVATVAWKGELRLETVAGGFVATGVVGGTPFGKDVDHVLARIDDGRGVLASTTGKGVSVSPAAGSLDLVHPESILGFDGAAVPASAVIPVDVMEMIDRVALILKAASIVGSAQYCIEAATEHATTRKQFGKPLIANQAIRHHLARHKLAFESAKVVLDRAVMPGASLNAARSAYAIAVNAGIQIAEGAIQVHGGMGFTWEVPLHFHLRHVRSIETQCQATTNLDRLGASYIEALSGTSVAA